MPLGPGQHGGGQHDVIAADARQAAKVRTTRRIGSSEDVEQVAAVDVQFGAQLVQLGEQALGQADRQARRPRAAGRLMLVRGLDHHGVAAVLIR